MGKSHEEVPLLGVTSDKRMSSIESSIATMLQALQSSISDQIQRACSNYYPSITMAEDGPEADHKNIKKWQLRKLIRDLESARGNGPSLISLITPPSDQISRVTEVLRDEYGTALNIQSRVDRESMLGAITCAQQRLKLYRKVPLTGLVLYTGTIVTEDGKEKKVSFEFAPFDPINVSLYRCDNKFHTEALRELLEADDKFGQSKQYDDKFGFIVMDRYETLFGTLTGKTREVIHDFYVDVPPSLPYANNQSDPSYILSFLYGGLHSDQSDRHSLDKTIPRERVKKAAELATQLFINPAMSQPNVSGLILALSAEFEKNSFQSSLDPRLRAKILTVVDVSYGGEYGFDQAIKLSAELLPNVNFSQEQAELLANVKFSQEQKLIGYGEVCGWCSDDTIKTVE